jgi:hypothetical protein
MSFITALESFASKVEKEFEELWGKAPSLATIASTTLTFVGPILETVVTVEDGSAAGTAVTAVINKVEMDLSAVKGLLTVVGPTVSVKGLISGAQNDLASLLSAAQITDPKSVANVTLVINELAALATAFPSTAPAPTPAA